MFILICNYLVSPHLPYPYLHFSTEIRPISPSQLNPKLQGKAVVSNENVSNSWADELMHAKMICRTQSRVEMLMVLIWCWWREIILLTAGNQFAPIQVTNCSIWKTPKGKGLTCCPTVPYFRILSWPCLSFQLIYVQIEYFFIPIHRWSLWEAGLSHMSIQKSEMSID